MKTDSESYMKFSRLISVNLMIRKSNELLGNSYPTFETGAFEAYDWTEIERITEQARQSYNLAVKVSKDTL